MLDFMGCTVHKGDKVLIASRRGSNSYLFEAEVLELYEDEKSQYLGWDLAQNAPLYRTSVVPMVRFHAVESGREWTETQDSYRNRLYVVQSAFGYHNDEAQLPS